MFCLVTDQFFKFANNIDNLRPIGLDKGCLYINKLLADHKRLDLSQNIVS